MSKLNETVIDIETVVAFLNEHNQERLKDLLIFAGNHVGVVGAFDEYKIHQDSDSYGDPVISVAGVVPE